MDFEEYVKFANEQRICPIATVEGDQPHVRTFGLWFADTTGFYFSTGKIKGVYRQLSMNPKVEGRTTFVNQLLSGFAFNKEDKEQEAQT